MLWIPQIMILDDDPRVLESLLPSFLDELAKHVGRLDEFSPEARRTHFDRHALPQIKVSVHGFESSRISHYRHRTPHQLHVHLVRERSGRFDLSRRLLNEQLFAVLVSDLRFSDEATGLKAGQLLIEETSRVHPDIQGLLYSAYPRPDGFPENRFLRKGSGAQGSGVLAQTVAKLLAVFLGKPTVSRFTRSIEREGLIYQSAAFGATLAQLFQLSRLFGPSEAPGIGALRSRRPLACLLIDGESGTGKRGLANVFHSASSRHDAPMMMASCNELTNELLLRSILFGHKRGAFTDAREDRPGLISAAGRGMVLLDDFHRLPNHCSAILHSFLEDGEYSRLGEEELRRQAESAMIMTVETEPWRERRRAKELPLAFLARVERLPVLVPPLRDRPEDIEVQALWFTQLAAKEFRYEIELSQDAIEGLQQWRFEESNSRELRNIIEQAVLRFGREVDEIDWDHFEQILRASRDETPPHESNTVDLKNLPSPDPISTIEPRPQRGEWSKRLVTLSARILAKELAVDPETATRQAEILFQEVFPRLWAEAEKVRLNPMNNEPRNLLSWSAWEDLWRCFAVANLGGPAPAERSLKIPANTLRQWISDRELKT